MLVSGLHKSLNANLWKPEHFSREFSSLHSDLYNCRDGSVTNSKVKEFWDGFEDVSSERLSTHNSILICWIWFCCLTLWTKCYLHSCVCDPQRDLNLIKGSQWCIDWKTGHQGRSFWPSCLPGIAALGNIWSICCLSDLTRICIEYHFVLLMLPRFEYTFTSIWINLFSSLELRHAVKEYKKFQK